MAAVDNEVRCFARTSGDAEYHAGPRETALQLGLEHAEARTAPPGTDCAAAVCWRKEPLLWIENGANESLE
jgi:hypothetical protein